MNNKTLIKFISILCIFLLSSCGKRETEKDRPGLTSADATSTPTTITPLALTHAKLQDVLTNSSLCKDAFFASKTSQIVLPENNSENKVNVFQIRQGNSVIAERNRLLESGGRIDKIELTRVSTPETFDISTGRIVASGSCINSTSNWDQAFYNTGSATCTGSGNQTLVCPAESVKRTISSLLNSGDGGESGICIATPTAHRKHKVKLNIVISPHEDRTTNLNLSELPEVHFLVDSATNKIEKCLPLDNNPPPAVSHAVCQSSISGIMSAHTNTTMNATCNTSAISTADCPDGTIEQTVFKVEAAGQGGESKICIPSSASSATGTIVASGFCMKAVSPYLAQSTTKGGASCNNNGQAAEVVCPSNTTKHVVSKLIKDNKGGEGALCLKI
jgi:hypothetical protein